MDEFRLGLESFRKFMSQLYATDQSIYFTENCVL